jgi:cobyrinic acid a,c-diamide synthase
MAGAFPIRAEMSDKFRALGYREITTKADTVLGPAGIMARGHEFHYSAIKENEGLQSLLSVYAMTGRKGRIDAQEGFQVGNVLGSYVHLHFGSRPEIAKSFVRACMACMDA